MEAKAITDPSLETKIVQVAKPLQAMMECLGKIRSMTASFDLMTEDSDHKAIVEQLNTLKTQAEAHVDGMKGLMISLKAYSA